MKKKIWRKKKPTSLYGLHERGVRGLHQSPLVLGHLSNTQGLVQVAVVAAVVDLKNTQSTLNDIHFDWIFLFYTYVSWAGFL